MRIAFLGTRGVPSSYSGFETFVEELGSRLAKRGHEVFVYTRTSHIKYPCKSYKGMHLIPLPTIPTKHLDTIFHTFLSTLHCLFKKYDVVYICNVGNSIVSWIPKLSGSKVVLNVNGADWKRKKWGKFASIFLRFSEYVAPYVSDVLISDSEAVKKYYLENFGVESVCIPYGGNLERDEGTEFLEKFGLSPQNYILFVGRLVPENGAHVLIQAFLLMEREMEGEREKEKLKLVIVGDAPYVKNYKKKLKGMARGNPNVIFTGYLFGKGYRQLSSNARIFVLPAEVGGTHPVLVEQMHLSSCIIARETPANIEVLEDAGLYFDGTPDDLKEKIKTLISSEELSRKLREKALERAKYYDWDKITQMYEELFSIC